MSLTVETNPEQVAKDLLDANWKDTLDFPKPNFVISNDFNDIIQKVNLNDGDYLIIGMTSPENFQPRGNCHYYDRVIPAITFTILSKVSRDRIRNLSKMVRAIMWDNKWDFTGYQIIKPVSYRELLNTDLNIWRAEVVFRAEAHAVPVETLT
jgi:hypothetical protein